MPTANLIEAKQEAIVSKVELGGGQYEGGLIRGVAVVTEGQSLNGQWHDQHFLEQVAESGEVKCFYNHPGWFEGESLEDFIGTFDNLVAESGVVKGDLHLLQSAKGKADQVLALAKEKPDFFGVSIRGYTNIDEQEKFRVQHLDEEGKFQSPDKENTENATHSRLDKLLSVDVVSNPASNPSGLFAEAMQMVQAACTIHPDGKKILTEFDRVFQSAAGTVATTQAQENTMPDPNPATAPTEEAIRSSERESVGKILAAAAPGQQELAMKLISENTSHDRAIAKLFESYKEGEEARIKEAVEAATAKVRLEYATEGEEEVEGAPMTESTGGEKKPTSAKEAWEKMSEDEKIEFGDEFKIFENCVKKGEVELK